MSRSRSRKLTASLIAAVSASALAGGIANAEPAGQTRIECATSALTPHPTVQGWGVYFEWTKYINSKPCDARYSLGLKAGPDNVAKKCADLMPVPGAVGATGTCRPGDDITVKVTGVAAGFSTLTARKPISGKKRGFNAKLTATQCPSYGC